jgi:hypothetical protein
MHSTPNSEQNDPSVISIAPGEKLVSDEQALREELARLNERRSVVPDAGGLSLDPQVTSFRPNAVGRSSGIIKTAVRGLVGAVLLGCVSAAAFAWQSSYGHNVRSIVAELAPQLIPSSLLPGGKAEPETPSGPATAQAAAADPAPPAADAANANAQQPEPALQQQAAAPVQAASPAAAQAAGQDAATAAASSSPPDQAQLLQTMARDLTAAQQKIADLEASQQQLARDNAATAAQLKAAQDQVAHLLAKPEPKVSEAKPEPGVSGTKLYAQPLRPKPPAAPRRPVAATYARPVTAAMPRPLAPPLPPQAAAQPPAPAPLPAPIVQPSDDTVQMTSAPRPPMPVPQ